MDVHFARSIAQHARLSPAGDGICFPSRASLAAVLCQSALAAGHDGEGPVQVAALRRAAEAAVDSAAAASGAGCLGLVVLKDAAARVGIRLSPGALVNIERRVAVALQAQQRAVVPAAAADPDPLAGAPDDDDDDEDAQPLVAARSKIKVMSREVYRLRALHKKWKDRATLAEFRLVQVERDRINAVLGCKLGRRRRAGARRSNLSVHGGYQLALRRNVGHIGSGALVSALDMPISGLSVTRWERKLANNMCLASPPRLCPAKDALLQRARVRGKFKRHH
ncbi:unnamed protein product [Prorocentrum cordatum]|uniref:Uncharacterized protein n=1 Tax=Prorocentrum cordatum TaxID=2364126 RepID=A0ABN9QYN3_9DINO|nr:unnamed protein product [Polarella glacialis]